MLGKFDLNESVADAFGKLAAVIFPAPNCTDIAIAIEGRSREADALSALLAWREASLE